LLAQAVQSVLSQSVPPVELLVVDDGSAGRDAADALAGLAPRPGIRLRVLAGPRRGPAAARNIGLGEAVGELVAFLDDDDLWLPWKLAWQLAWFTGRERLGALGALWWEHSATEPVRFAGERPRRLRRVSLGSLLRGNRLATSGVVARREALAHIGGFDQSLSLAQDWDMWLRLAETWEIAVVPAQLVVYRRHRAQRSAHKERMRRFEADVLRRALARGALRSRLLEGVARRRLAWAHGRMGRLLAGEGKFETAIAELKESMDLFACNPVVWMSLLRCLVARRALARAEP
jgi:hypothetical protein